MILPLVAALSDESREISRAAAGSSAISRLIAAASNPVSDGTCERKERPDRAAAFCCASINAVCHWRMASIC